VESRVGVELVPNPVSSPESNNDLVITAIAQGRPLLLDDFDERHVRTGVPPCRRCRRNWRLAHLVEFWKTYEFFGAVVLFDRRLHVFVFEFGKLLTNALSVLLIQSASRKELGERHGQFICFGLFHDSSPLTKFWNRASWRECGAWPFFGSKIPW